ncbi:MAG: SLBB domain-containing protein [Candidatus Marinimicrobia bacterium]|nr:SLBB domain-containing protein [Candidatus Neomarinimicrobiota bacterium]
MKFFSNKDRIDKIRRTWMVTSVVILTSGVLLGQTAEELKEFKKRMAELEALQETISPVEPAEIETEIPARGEIVIERPKIEKAALPYFGYDFFTKRERLDIYNNLPLPRDYQLGPGDEIIISIWGETQLRSSHVINRDGEIFIDKVGLVNISGITMREAKAVLQNHFERVYATLKTNPKSTTFLDVSLGELKAINISFVGEVTVPGMYSIHPFSTVTTGLIQSGGVALTGTLRNIQAIRNKRLIQQVDLYSFLLKGETEGDIRLQNGDIVFVPVRESTVTITGAIRRPAIYETRGNEVLTSLISYAGQLRADAGSQIQLSRITPISDRITDDYAVKTFLLSMQEADNFEVHDGDKYIVTKIHDVERQIEVLGQVKIPGVYPFNKGMDLREALELAGGIFDEDYWQSIYSTRAEILRRQEDNDYAEIIVINLEELRAGNEDQNLRLENYDQIVVHRNPKFEPQRNIVITGEVELPGVYSIRRDGETLQELFEVAGGFTERAFEEGIEMTRGGKRVVLRDYTIPVAPGDSIMVPEYPGVITVIGEVHNAGLIHYKPGMSLKDYIESAGGFTTNANKGDISILYANGDVKKRSWIFDPKIREGATIIIHRAEEREPFDTTDFLKEMASIVASLATVIYIIATI